MNMKDIESKQLARDLKDAYDIVSPFIEKHAAIVCPDCESVCCKDKHAHYDENDFFFLRHSVLISPATHPAWKRPTHAGT